MKLEYLSEGSPECPLIRLYDFTTDESGLTASTWNHIVDLIEPFTRAAVGFQWLSGPPGEAALLLSADGKW